MLKIDIGFKQLREENQELRERVTRLEEEREIFKKDIKSYNQNVHNVDNVHSKNYNDYQDNMPNVNINISKVEVKNIVKPIGNRENVNSLYSEVTKSKLKDIDKKCIDLEAVSNNTKNVHNIESASQYFEEKKMYYLST